MPQKIPPRVDLQREDIEDARTLSESQKLLLGGDLFDAACEVTMSGIRAENPGITREAALNLLRQRLEKARLLETRI